MAHKLACRLMMYMRKIVVRSAGWGTMNSPMPDAPTVELYPVARREFWFAVVGGYDHSHYLEQKRSAATPSRPYFFVESVHHSLLLVLHPGGEVVFYTDHTGWDDCVESPAHWMDAALATT